MRATNPGQSALLALDVIDMLNRLRVPYAIIGALAASFYGVVRASLDVDAVISLRPGQAELTALTDALHQAGLKTTYRKGDIRDPVGAVLNIEDAFHNRVDLLMNIHGTTESVFTRTVEAEFMSTTIRVIGLEDFIAMKMFSGSPKDLDDAAGAFKVSADRVRMPLLKELVGLYGKEAARRLESLLRERQS
jgi:predicted nucleotidyltransferase